MANSNGDGDNDDCSWQMDKTLLECNQHMFDTRAATDITFLVGMEDGPSEEISAHKYVLFSRSPVFFAMLCGGLAHRDEEHPIPIKDIEPAAFQEMLRYLYYEEANLNPHTALHVMYAAKKYLVTRLVKMCNDFLESILDPENICSILDQSIMFDEEDLIQSCLRYISLHTESVLDSEDFTRISYLGLKRIVDFQQVMVDELKLFKACLRWAHAECMRRNLEAEPARFREVLGDALYCIRMPQIGLKDFANIVVEENILSPEETVQMFKYYTADKKPEIPFAATRLNKHGRHTINRFQSVVKMDSERWNVGGSTDAIDFLPHVDIWLCQIGVYGGKMKGVKHDVHLTLLDSDDKVLVVIQHQTEADGCCKPIPIPLQHPIRLKAQEWFTIKLKMKGMRTFYGEYGRSEWTNNEVKFNFKNSRHSDNGTKVNMGQIPELLFDL